MIEENGDSPGKRLAAFRNSLNLSQRAFGGVLGVSGGLVGQIEADLSPPSRGFLTKLSDAYGINADWLLNGHGQMMRTPGSGFEGRKVTIETPDRSRPGHGEIVIQGKDYSWVRRMGLSVSAGSGLEELEPEDEDGLLLPSSWFGRRGINPDLCVIVSVRGDSMAPTIPDGAMVLIDCTKKTVEQSGIYAVALDGQAYVKRLIPSRDAPEKPPSAILMVSDSPGYTPVPLVGDRMNALRVVGRVRAVLSDL